MVAVQYSALQVWRERSYANLDSVTSQYSSFNASATKFDASTVHSCRSVWNVGWNLQFVPWRFE